MFAGSSVLLELESPGWKMVNTRRVTPLKPFHNKATKRTPDGKMPHESKSSPRELKQYCALDEAATGMLQMGMTDMNLSARAYDRILKVARTIADLAGAESILSDHLSEAIRFRSLVRQIWGRLRRAGRLLLLFES